MDESTVSSTITYIQYYIPLKGSVSQSTCSQYNIIITSCNTSHQSKIGLCIMISMILELVVTGTSVSAILNC